MDGQPLFSIHDLKTYYSAKRNLLGRTTSYLRAVDGVSFDIHAGETVGLVGESGCGKSTLGRTILRLETPYAGNILYEGNDLAELSQKEMLPYRKQLQIVFQDPYSSLNPRQRVRDILSEPLHVHSDLSKSEVREKIDEILATVGLPGNAKDRFPNEFSGGQRQRIGIARALILSPRFVVCDEPVSALDVSVQAQIMNLLVDLQQGLGLTYLFIAHGLGVVRYISTRIAVMYLGKIVEFADTKELVRNPLHPYSSLLLNSYPVPDPEKRSRPREAFVCEEGPVGTSCCRFCSRCPYATERCRNEEPELRGSTHQVACFLHG